MTVITVPHKTNFLQNLTNKIIDFRLIHENLKTQMSFQKIQYTVVPLRGRIIMLTNMSITLMTRIKENDVLLLFLNFCSVQ